MTESLPVTEGQPISGEAREKARRRRLYTIIGVLFAVGFLSGFGLAFAEEDGAGFLEGPIPAWVAILLSLVWLAAMIFGTMRYKKNVDELEVLINVWAMAVAGGTFMIGYPVWYLLWRGQMMSEPSAHIIFIALYFVALGAYCWKKYR